jgi:protein phosphatase
MSNSIASRILDAYEQLLNLGTENVVEIGVSVQIPQIPEASLLLLCDAAISRFAAQPIYLELTGEYYVVGDTHGNLIDLLRILYQMHRPPFSNILFLGDFVDRGPFSIEVVTLVLALTCSYPDCVHIIRGNHEFGPVNRVYGFYDEVMSIYKSEALWKRFQDAFAWMPFAAVINQRIFCVHGGISQHLPDVKQLARYERPIHDLEDPALIDLVWADPSSYYQGYGISRRGISYGFGAEATRIFLKTNHFLKIIRAHEFVMAGVEECHGGNVVTVFSTSTGADNGRNLIGFLKIDEKNESKPTVLYPGPAIARADALFKAWLEPHQRRTGGELKASPSFLQNGLLIARRSSDAKRKSLSPSRSMGLDSLVRGGKRMSDLGVVEPPSMLLAGEFQED